MDLLPESLPLRFSLAFLMRGRCVASVRRAVEAPVRAAASRGSA